MTGADLGTLSEYGLPAVKERSAELFALLLDPRTTAAVSATARDQLAHLHMPLVEHCARRFRNRGELLEDLVQVGAIGLIKSIDRFDTERGVEFSHKPPRRSSARSSATCATRGGRSGCPGGCRSCGCRSAHRAPG